MATGEERYFFYKGQKVKLIRVTYIRGSNQYCTIELPSGQPVSVQMRNLKKSVEGRRQG